MKRKCLAIVIIVLFATHSFATTIDGSTLSSLSVISASGIGTTLVTTAEIGTLATGAGIAVAIGAGVAYYAQTGENPVYAAASSVASGADALFSPAYQAFKANFVSPESFPASAAQYVGKNASVGGTLDNIFNIVQAHSTDYPKLSSLLASHTSPSTGYAVDAVAVGSVITDNVGNRWTVTAITSTSTLNAAAYPVYVASTRATITYNAHKGWLDSGMFSVFYPELGIINYKYYNGVTLRVVATTNPATVDPVPGGLIYTDLKAALNNANLDAGLANEIRSAVNALPIESKIISSNAAPNTLPAAPPSVITNNDISNFFTANTVNVYNEYLNTTANGGDVDTAQAAAELAKAQEAEAEKETEPNFPIPGTWYTKTCDLSKGLGQCIDYQQIRNATNSFNNTFVVQFPNLILDCLGYVEGDGCTYPPILTIDFHNRFSNEPIRIDMAPFESVANIMKFFFSLLCLLLTGKSVMYLFQ